MCGGFAAKFNKIPQKEIQKYFSPREIDNFKAKGFIQSFFWGKRPVLPVEVDNKVKLYDWGNRDKKTPFPQTGWAKIESVEKGKWNWLNPKKVKIPIDRGFEKKVWFDLKNGTQGLIVEIKGDQRAYMITEPADSNYFFQTRHNRMPPGPKNNFQKLKNKP